MNNKKILPNVILTGLLFAFTTVVQFIGLPNILTGIIVNSFYILILFIGGLKYAVMLAILTPCGAALTGHLPPPLFPMIPVISAGNMIYAFTYNIFKSKDIILRYTIAPFLKSLIIWLGGLLALKLFNIDRASEFILFTVISIQFFTSAAGIFVGELIFKKLPERYIKN